MCGNGRDDFKNSFGKTNDPKKKKKIDNLENQAQSERTSRLTTEIKTVELAKKGRHGVRGLGWNPEVASHTPFSDF